jgi:hypothetical protein
MACTHALTLFVLSPCSQPYETVLSPVLYLCTEYYYSYDTTYRDEKGNEKKKNPADWSATLPIVHVTMVLGYSVAVKFMRAHMGYNNY